MGKYCCAICGKVSKQKSHHEAHLESELHLTKVENFKLKMQHKSIYDIIKEYPEYLSDIPDDINEEVAAKCKFDLIEKIVVHKTTQIMENSNPESYKMNTTISNREALREKIHEIHNFLRNNGAGYGMAALKVFNIFYGLKRIEENNLFDKLDLSEECKFSFLLEKSKGDDEELCNIVYNKVLDSLNDSDLKYFLFYEIPRNMKGNVFSHLINELDKLTDIEKSSGEQLTGKIYEYFIGRDKQAISELGAYFTNRLIVEYIYKQLDLELEEDGTIGTMIDPFGGSGGFTTGYINWMKEKYPDLDWSSEINKIHHYDMNEDVIKSAALEFFCITGEVPNMKHLQYKNSFTDEFENMKFKYCITNPPYGGDKNKKSDAENKREKIKKYIKDELKTLTDKDIIKRRNEQLKHIDTLNKLEKKRLDEQKVTLEKSSKRIKKFAKKYGIKGNDKEAVSLMLMMDMVEEGGVGCGVLKEGVFFNKTYKNLRKCLLENYNVTKVISIPSDQFENTSTKTSIIIFKNTEEKTSSVQFYDLSCVTFDKDKIEEIDGKIVLTENEGDVKGVEDKLVSVANVKDILNQKDISLTGKEYNKIDIVPGDGYELVRLGDICELKNGNQLDKKNMVQGDYPVFGGGKHIVGYHNDYNRENCTIISGTGNYSGYVSYCDKKIWASQCFTIKSDNIDINNYIKYYCKSNQEYFMNSQGGSAQSFIRAQQFENLKISIPTDKQKMIEWSDKISEPYNEKLDKENRIKELEKELQERVKTISENEDCEEKTIEELYNVIYGDKNKLYKTNDKVYYSIGGGSNINNLKKTENWNTKENTIIIARSGSPGHVNMFYSKTLVGSFAFTLNYKENTNNKYNYTFLKSNQQDLINMGAGSVQNNLNRDNLKQYIIKIPKNKQLITDMEPQFQELEQLYVDVKNADKKYKDLIEELKNEAIQQ